MIEETLWAGETDETPPEHQKKQPLNKMEAMDLFLEHAEPDFEKARFTWTKRLNRKTTIGGEVHQCLAKNGYFEVRFYRDGKQNRMYSHRILFYAKHGYLPEFLDHIDRDRKNNSIQNLRPATSSQNKQNASIRSDNTSGFVGVQLRKESGKWRSLINLNKKAYHLGDFTDKNDAIKARKDAEESLYGEFAAKRNL